MSYECNFASNDWYSSRTMGDSSDCRLDFVHGVLDLDGSRLRNTRDFDRCESGMAFGHHLWMDDWRGALLSCAEVSALFCRETNKVTMPPNNRVQATPDCAVLFTLAHASGAFDAGR
jgi:hypothetical protein